MCDISFFGCTWRPSDGRRLEAKELFSESCVQGYSIHVICFKFGRKKKYLIVYVLTGPSSGSKSSWHVRCPSTLCIKNLLKFRILPSEEIRTCYGKWNILIIIIVENLSFTYSIVNGVDMPFFRSYLATEYAHCTESENQLHTDT